MSLPDFKYKQCLFYFSSKERDKLRFLADRLVIENENGEIKLQHSCHKAFALFIVGNITMTNIILQKAKKFGFPILLLSYNFRLDSYLHNRAEGNFLIRKKQYETTRNLSIAKQLVKQKINNQVFLLKKLRFQSEQDKNTLTMLKNVNVDLADESRQLMGYEGTASKAFFSCFFRNINWNRREPRTKSDINNLLLDIGYTYLFNFIEAMTAIYGFDVYCGVYHKFFYQRKSLICDLVEPFRCIIDQRLRKAHNLKQIDERDFFIKNGHYNLAYKHQTKYTRLFVKDILEYKEDIFLFIQQYYRWFMKDKELKHFPVFKLEGKN